MPTIYKTNNPKVTLIDHRERPPEWAKKGPQTHPLLDPRTYAEGASIEITKSPRTTGVLAHPILAHCQHPKRGLIALELLTAKERYHLGEAAVRRRLEHVTMLLRHGVTEADYSPQSPEIDPPDSPNQRSRQRAKPAPRAQGRTQSKQRRTF